MTILCAVCMWFSANMYLMFAFWLGGSHLQNLSAPLMLLCINHCTLHRRFSELILMPRLYVCIFACMYACIHALMYRVSTIAHSRGVFPNWSLCHVYMYVYLHVCMHVFMLLCIVAHSRRGFPDWSLCHVYMYVYLMYSNCHLGWRTLVLKCNKNNYDWCVHALMYQVSTIANSRRGFPDWSLCHVYVYVYVHVIHALMQTSDLPA
jgi:hypothetical protein